jgi:hypothetical protein
MCNLSMHCLLERMGSKLLAPFHKTTRRCFTQTHTMNRLCPLNMLDTLGTAKHSYYILNVRLTLDWVILLCFCLCWMQSSERLDLEDNHFIYLLCIHLWSWQSSPLCFLCCLPKSNTLGNLGSTTHFDVTNCFDLIHEYTLRRFVWAEMVTICKFVVVA